MEAALETSQELVPEHASRTQNENTHIDIRIRPSLAHRGDGVTLASLFHYNTSTSRARSMLGRWRWRFL
jgi:hypothetical protein